MSAARPSFERIDYQLRHNKYIERRLIFERLSRGKAAIDFDAYRYLGFGSMWFVDFKYAHRVLGISNLLSMERAVYAERASFNQPLRCIYVVGGESGDTLRDIPAAEWEAPVLAWLDYDGALTEGHVSDFRRLLASSSVGSVVLLTVNGDFRSYRPRDPGRPRNRSETSIGRVEELLQASVVAPRFERGQGASGAWTDLDERTYAEFLAVALLSWCKHVVTETKRRGPASELEFVPLFNFCHQDGAEMVTIGGALVDDSNRETWLGSVAAGVTKSVEDIELPQHERLDLVPLTAKEKLALDRLLPVDADTFISQAKAAGIRVDDSQLTKYRNYYKQFPLFFDTLV